MNRLATLTTLAALITVTAPFAGAEWFHNGAFEPDTYLDTSAFMPQDKPWTEASNGAVTHSDAKSVYFNAWIERNDVATQTGQTAQNGGPINVNVAMLHSRLDPPGSYSFAAILGVWTDCNFDGYVGLGEQGVREYRIEVFQQYIAAQNALRAQAGKPALSVPSRCLNSGLPGENVWNGQNGFGGWVTELIPIYGRGEFLSPDRFGGTDKKSYQDYDAAVWADPGRPNDPFATSVPSNCHFTGTAFHRHYGHTTGAMLRAIDCEGDRQVLDQDVGIIEAYNGVVGLVEPDLRFDETSDCASCGEQPPQNPENDLDFNPWEACYANADFECAKGGDHWDNTYIRAQDCESGSAVVNDIPPVGGQAGGDIYNLPDSNGDGVPDVVNPGGSIAGTYNRTTEEFDPSPEDDQANDGVTQSSNCNPNDDTGHGVYENLETNPNALTPGKSRATWNFNSAAAARGNVPASLRWPGGASGGSTDLGVDLLNTCAPAGLVGCASSNQIQQWGVAGAGPGTLPNAGFGDTTPFYLAPISRSIDNQDGETDLEQSEARYWTFYATIGNLRTSKSLVAPTGGNYGAAQCSNVSGGKVNVSEPAGQDWRVLINDRATYPYLGVGGFECNTRLWNIEADGTWDDVAVREAVVGDHYDLRDVDCLDGTFTAASIQFATSPASLRDPGDNQDVDPDTPGDQSTLTTRCRGPGQNPPSWA